MSAFGPCPCYTCDEERRAAQLAIDGDFFKYASRRMILCPKCGNKRCPHSTFHKNKCTGSNEPGQLGSRYGRLPDDLEK